jgi:hypothetical protein
MRAGRSSTTEAEVAAGHVGLTTILRCPPSRTMVLGLVPADPPPPSGTRTPPGSIGVERQRGLEVVRDRSRRSAPRRRTVRWASSRSPTGLPDQRALDRLGQLAAPQAVAGRALAIGAHLQLRGCRPAVRSTRRPRRATLATTSTQLRRSPAAVEVIAEQLDRDGRAGARQHVIDAVREGWPTVMLAPPMVARAARSVGQEPSRPARRARSQHRTSISRR